jgi:hypothetical protein
MGYDNLMGRPYLSRLLRLPEVTAYLVDGAFIRDTIDVDFTNGAHHFSRDYVPLDEVWIDRDAPGTREVEFWLRHQLRERADMAAGASYLDALRRSNRIEKIERREHARELPTDRATAQANVRLSIMGRVGRDVVWLVSGHRVRTLFDVNFTQGGHGLRYRFIPRREIWIDDAAIAREREVIVAHEVHELHLMRQGMRYHPAHTLALDLEAALRARRAAPQRASKAWASLRKRAA